jgi:peptidoglycan/xylan/chitin deacetylase (PgdA/CDA1 family)
MKKIFLFFVLILTACKIEPVSEPVYLGDFTNSELLDVYPFDFVVNYEYSNDIEEGLIVSQSISPETSIEMVELVEFVVSKGKLDLEQMKNDGINEYGKIPVVMYHGIELIPDEETGYNGGNTDKYGYSRTVESFKDDLEMFYQLGYMPISINDYVDGNIDVPYGKSPMVITFDDGLLTQFNVILDDNGNQVVDPNCAVGILESFKEKYDWDLTAMFYLNSRMFDQWEHIEFKLNYLVEHGYELGNHTYSHMNLGKATDDEIQTDIGRLEELVHKYLPTYEFRAMSLPYGAYPEWGSELFNLIENGVYNGNEYHYDSIVMVGWMPELSVFHPDFKEKHNGMIMRVRGSDQVGNDEWTNINYIFEEYLLDKRYISDGKVDRVIGPIDYMGNESEELEYQYYE